MKPFHRNVIKFNPTPMVLFGDVRNLTFSYERLIKDNQSLCFQAGYLTFPDIFADTIAGLISFTGSRSDFDVGFRYAVSLGYHF